MWDAKPKNPPVTRYNYTIALTGRNAKRSRPSTTVSCSGDFVHQVPVPVPASRTSTWCQGFQRLARRPADRGGWLSILFTQPRTPGSGINPPPASGNPPTWVVSSRSSPTVSGPVLLMSDCDWRMSTAFLRRRFDRVTSVAVAHTLPSRGRAPRSIDAERNEWRWGCFHSYRPPFLCRPVTSSHLVSVVFSGGFGEACSIFRYCWDR